MFGVPTAETLELMKAAQATPMSKSGITTATGLTYYDLQAPSLKLFPTPSPLRNMIPRVMGGGDTATHWKAITSINTDNMFAGVSEGNRGGVITTTSVPYSAAYSGIGLENSVSFESDYAAQGFEDVKATSAMLLLKTLMQQEEFLIVGGNNSLALGQAAQPTCTFATSGGSIVNGEYYVGCVALTLDGKRRAAVSATGVVQSFTKTNADGSTDTVNGGSGKPSALSAKITVTGGSGTAATVSASVTAIPGAVAYAWYIGTTGDERIVAITTINSVKITALPTGTNQLHSALAATDNSRQSQIFDGILTFAATAANNAYTAALATGTPGTGTTLTADGLGGITEFTAAFVSFYDNYRLSPTHIWVSSAQLQKIKSLLLNTTGQYSNVRFTGDMNTSNNLVAGIGAIQMINPITGDTVQVSVHPFLPAGTILFTTDRLPYEVADVPNPLQIKTRRDYYQLEWPLVTRKYQYGVYADEVLQCYAPFSLGIIYNVA